MELVINEKMNAGKAVDIGMDVFVECVKFGYEDNLEDTFITLSLNVLGVIYSLTISKYEADDPNNIKDGWKALVEQFGVYHLIGQSKRIQDGSREITADEKAIMNGETNEEKR